MRFKIHARKFESDGRVRCVRCQSMVVFPDNASIIIWDNGKRVRILDPQTNMVVHVCGRITRWKCDMCDSFSEPTSNTQRRKFTIDVNCKLCNMGRLVPQATNESEEG